jgi:hypothetical protein
MAQLRHQRDRGIDIQPAVGNRAREAFSILRRKVLKMRPPVDNFGERVRFDHHITVALSSRKMESCIRHLLSSGCLSVDPKRFGYKPKRFGFVIGFRNWRDSGRLAGENSGCQST